MESQKCHLIVNSFTVYKQMWWGRGGVGDAGGWLYVFDRIYKYLQLGYYSGNNTLHIGNGNRKEQYYRSHEMPCWSSIYRTLL